MFATFGGEFESRAAHCEFPVSIGNLAFEFTRSPDRVAGTHGSSGPLDRRVMSQFRLGSAYPPTSPTRRSDPAIQSLRGIAAIVLVAGHVIVNNDIVRHGPWNFLWVLLVDIRMPLFTLISGYVYAMTPVDHWQDYPRLIKGKSRRLLLPLITVGAVLYVMKRSVPGLDSKWHTIAFWHIYVFRFEHLWFLQSIFIIFLVVGILDSSRLLASRVRWCAATAIAAIIFVVVHVPTEVDVFTVSGALHLLPFFLLGYGLRRYSLFDLRGVPAAAVTVAFAGVFTLRLFTIFGVYHPDEFVDKAIAVGVGATALVLIYSARNLLNTRLLTWVGGFSFGIYLLHPFPVAASRKLLEHFGIHGDWEFLVVGVAVSIAAPIAFQIMFRNVWFVRTLVLGERGAGRYSFRCKNRRLVGSGAGAVTPWRSVSSPRPSNRACGSPAHGSPMPFTGGVRFLPPGPGGAWVRRRSH
jgi:acyltransferase